MVKIPLEDLRAFRVTSCGYVRSYKVVVSLKVATLHNTSWLTWSVISGSRMIVLSLSEFCLLAKCWPFNSVQVT